MAVKNWFFFTRCSELQILKQAERRLYFKFEREVVICLSYGTIFRA